MAGLLMKETAQPPPPRDRGKVGRGGNWQGRKDLNPRPSVLEFPASILPTSPRVGAEFKTAD